jgi:ABC-2 type transport system ATP-binding protein
VRALAGLDLRVPRGAVFGLLGPNGAGKTTLVKLLLGIAFPTGGRATVLGRPPGDIEGKARIGYLPENHRYPPHLTGEEVLHYFGRLSGLRSPGRSVRVDELLRRVKLDGRRSARVRTYSKGMMQRLGMAQALLNDPELLILDEPTDGIDPIGRHEIRDILIEQAGRGTTIFLNSHLLSEVERLCTRVAILKDGHLVREGGVEELTRPANVHEVEVRGLTPEALAALQTRIPGLRIAEPAPGAAASGPGSAAEEAAAGRLRLELRGDPEAVNRLIDALREQRVEITAVRQSKESLEDVFVKVVGEAVP